MNKQTFLKLFSNIESQDPDDIFLLVNGEEISYRTVVDSNIISWVFMISPKSTEIEMIGLSLLNSRHSFQSKLLINASHFIQNYSPLKQMQLDIAFENIQCKETLVLIQKYDGSPACVTESTKQKLIERGWGNKTITVQNSDFVISYSVTKGELISAMANLDTQSLVLDVQMIDDGNMTVKLPRGLIDSINNGKDEVFTVLVEGKKVEHKEQNTQNHRILNFPLLSSETGSVIVEIIPYCPSWKCN